MKKFILSLMAALMITSVVGVPYAEAQRRHHHHHHRNHYNWAVPLALGVIGTGIYYNSCWRRQPVYNNYGQIVTERSVYVC